MHQTALQQVATWLTMESQTKADAPLDTSSWEHVQGDQLKKPRQEDLVSCGVFTFMWVRIGSTAYLATLAAPSLSAYQCADNHAA